MLSLAAAAIAIVAAVQAPARVHQHTPAVERSGTLPVVAPTVPLSTGGLWTTFRTALRSTRSTSRFCVRARC
jgi:hypothetical protein